MSERDDRVRVVAAAIRMGGEVISLPPPARHNDILAHMAKLQHGIYRVPAHTQGFLISDGRFADRRAARKIAEAAGQLLPRDMGLPELYSEDVW